MDQDTYSVYDAKARFSEILRAVGRHRRVVITSRGKPVAEVIPYVDRSETLHERLDRLEAGGLVEAPTGDPSVIVPLIQRPGALARFLEDRD